jgi:hypothetical protein
MVISGNGGHRASGRIAEVLGMSPPCLMNGFGLGLM